MGDKRLWSEVGEFGTDAFKEFGMGIKVDGLVEVLGRGVGGEFRDVRVDEA